jgi:hypothetical protein
MKCEITETRKYVTIKFEKRDLIKLDDEIGSLVDDNDKTYALNNLREIIRQAIVCE